jgi:uncharacterized protein
MEALERLIDQYKQRILFQCVSGSRAYGTSNAQSDTDIRGVFVQPNSEFLALAPPVPLLADERHNTVYYSLRRTLELLQEANPNILELLYMPPDCVQIQSPEYAKLLAHRPSFITRQCADTHIGYAFSQIKKAKGQNKWINQPKPEQAPAKEAFCHVIHWTSARVDNAPPCRPLPLIHSGLNLAHCHAARLEHTENIYRLYAYGEDAKGVFRGDVLTPESIPIEDENSCFIGLLLFNERAWRQSLEDHRNYWTWRTDRNESRWRQQESGELDFDAKNLMHTVRLLLSGKSILENGEPIVRFAGESLALLRNIRAGKLSYEQIINIANDLRADCQAIRERNDLPEIVQPSLATRILQELTYDWEKRCL